MTTLPAGMAPYQAGAGQVESLKGGTLLGEGKKGRAHIMNVAGKRRFLGIQSAAGPVLRFEQEDAPTLARQRGGRHQTIGSRSDHKGVRHTWIPGGSWQGNCRESGLESRRPRRVRLEDSTPC